MTNHLANLACGHDTLITQLGIVSSNSHLHLNIKDLFDEGVHDRFLLQPFILHHEPTHFRRSIKISHRNATMRMETQQVEHLELLYLLYHGSSSLPLI